MFFFKRNDGPVTTVEKAAKKARKSVPEVKADIEALKIEYGLPEEFYFENKCYSLSRDDMFELANNARLKKYRRDRIAEATGLDFDEVDKKIAEAVETLGIDEKEYFEGEYYLYKDLEKRKAERDAEHKKDVLKKSEIKTIMEATGWSKDEVLERVKYVKDNFGINAKAYYVNKYYMRTETVMARLNTARLKKASRNAKLFDNIKSESGKTPQEVRAKIKELNERFTGMNFNLSSYYAYGYHLLDDEEIDRISEVIMKKRGIVQKFDGKDESLFEEYKGLVKEILSSSRKRQLFSVIHTAIPELVRNDEKTEELLVDMQATKELLGFELNEYVSFKFWEKSFEERQGYVSNGFKADILKRLNTLEGRTVADNKFAAYQILKPYYHRDAVLLEYKNGYEEFKKFCAKHKSFVKKSNFDSLGMGLKKVTIDENTVLRNLYDDLTVNGKRILLEELIEVHPDIAFLNPNSVNTVRITTFVDLNGNVTVQDSSMRIGRKDSFVDNAGAGGILVHIDKNTGKFDTNGVDKTGKRYETHPDHGYKFLGYQLPDWDKMLTTIKELATKVDGLKYIGWDMTYTKQNNWVVVECNGITQFFGQQATVNRGRKQALLDAVSETLEYMEKEKEAKANE